MLLEEKASSPEADPLLAIWYKELHWEFAKLQCDFIVLHFKDLPEEERNVFLNSILNYILERLK